VELKTLTLINDLTSSTLTPIYDLTSSTLTPIYDLTSSGIVDLMATFCYHQVSHIHDRARVKYVTPKGKI
jgi:hypothetical protein